MKYVWNTNFQDKYVHQVYEGNNDCAFYAVLYICNYEYFINTLLTTVFAAYKKFNKFAQAFGIQLDYETFQKIKKNYGFEGNLMDSSAQQKAAANYN